MILDEIIELRKQTGIDFGETYAQQLRHYKGAMHAGNLEYISRNGRIVGFIEWVRLPRPPATQDFSWKDYPVQKGDYVYIINMVGKGVLKELISMAKKKNKDAKYYCYHQRVGEVIPKKFVLKIFDRTFGKEI